MTARARFVDWCATRFPSPADALGAYFEDAAAAALSVGALLDTLPEVDGKRHYLPNLAGKRDSKTFYIASIEQDKDGTAWPCITFKSFKGSSVYWKPRDLAWQEYEAAGIVAANDNARRDYKAAAMAAIESARQKAADGERQKEAGREAAAAVALAAWEAAEPCEVHQYLARKGVEPHGLRVARRDMRARLWNDEAGAWQDVAAVRAGDLLIPMHDAAGRLVSLQRIDATGRKRFIMGGCARGSHFRINGTTGRTVLAEGYATGATWHAATGDSVVLAFNAGALPVVAGYLAADLVAADHDASGTGEKAARATGLPWVMPPVVGMDWNDFSAAQGIEAMRAALAKDIVTPFVGLDSLRAVDLKGREDTWLNALAKADNQGAASALAWTIMRRLFASVPARFDVAGLAALVSAHAPACGFAPEFMPAAVDRLSRRLFMRRKQALSCVSFSAEAVQRHNYERRASLPTLTPEDYEGVILVRAPKATGKTKTILKPFADWAADHGRFVAVVHRVSLVRELARVLVCDVYTEVSRERADGIFGFATCLPSIVRGAHQAIIKNCDYLAVDEIAQTLAFIESETACKSEGVSNAGVYEALREMVRKAKCIIGADAGLNDSVLAFLESCRPGERFKIIDVADADKGLTAFHGWGDDGLSAALGEMQHLVREGKNIWVSCDTRRMAEAVAAWMRETTDRPVLCITRAKTPERERFLANAQEVSREYAAVIHSPAISSGLSIEHDHFTHGFLIYSGCTIAPQDASQMLRRCRQLRSWTISLSANKRRGMSDPDAMLTAMQDAARMAGTIKRATGFDGFIADIRAQQEQARADGAAGLLWQLEAERFTLKPLDATPDAAAMEGCKLARQALREEERRAILAAPDLTEDEAQALRRQSAQTREEEATLARHIIAKGLRVDTVDEAALDAWERIGPTTLDRFASAFMGYTGRANDKAEHLSQRTPHKARAAAYAALFDGLGVREGMEITDELADKLLDRVISSRFALAWLGMVSAATYGAVMMDKDGNVLPFKRPAYPRREACELFRRLGLAIRQGKSKGKERYFLPDDFSAVREWAERRAGGEMRHQVKAIQGISPPAANDCADWMEVRRDLWRRAGAESLTRNQAAAVLVPLLRGKPPTAAARLTAWWAREVLSDRLAA